MPTYHLYLFGAPRLECRGSAVSMDTRKALALLAYLLLTAEPHSRDSLAALLWPESGQTAARAALRRTLSTLRGALKEDLIDFGRDIIALNPGADLWCDVLAFHQALEACRTHGHPEEQVCPRCLDPLQTAVDLYKDDFLAGFGLRDSLEFDDWQFFEADQRRREQANALERLVACRENFGDAPAALEAAHRWLALDRLNEAAQRALIRLYAQSGQRTAALRQYRECVRILDEELGVSPLDETNRLYEAVKENRLEKPALNEQFSIASRAEPIQPPTDYRPLKADHVPLLGRASEWEQLARFYGGLSRNGFFVALTGETGIGKTRLGDDFLAHLKDRGAATLTTRCYAGERDLAYTPLIDLLRQGIRQSADRPWWQAVSPLWLAEAALLLPEITQLDLDIQLPAYQEGPGAQNRFYEGLCRVLEALLAGDLPGAVFMDNLDLADNSTLEWLAYLVRRLEDYPLFLLTTWGTETLLKSALIPQMINESIQNGCGAHLQLSPLTHEQSKALIQNYQENEVLLTDADQTWLIRESNGLPYFLVEYLEALRQEKIKLAPTPSERQPIPEGLRALLQTRLSSLSETTSQIAQAGAVLGRVFELDLLQAVSGRSEEEIIQGVEELQRFGLIDEGRSSPSQGQYEFRNEQAQALVLDEISMARRRLLHRRAAEGMQSRVRGDARVSLSSQIARHFQEAGMAEEAAEYDRRAGEFFRSIHANPDAIEHFQSALALGYPDKSDLQVQLGELFLLNGDYPQAIQQFEAAAAFSPADRLAEIDHKLGTVYLRRGDWELAGCHFEVALDELEKEVGDANPSLQSRIRADWSLACHRNGQNEQAAALAEQALNLAEQGKDPLALAQAYNLLGILARAAHDQAAALNSLENSLKFASQLDNLSAEIAALNNLALAQADGGDAALALETIRRAIERCLTLGDRHLEAALRNNHADLLRASGQYEAAMEQLKLAVAIFAEIGQQAEDWQPEIWKLVAW